MEQKSTVENQDRELAITKATFFPSDIICYVCHFFALPLDLLSYALISKRYFSLTLQGIKEDQLSQRQAKLLDLFWKQKVEKFGVDKWSIRRSTELSIKVYRMLYGQKHGRQETWITPIPAETSVGSPADKESILKEFMAKPDDELVAVFRRTGWKSTEMNYRWGVKHGPAYHYQKLQSGEINLLKEKNYFDGKTQGVQLSYNNKGMLFRREARIKDKLTEVESFIATDPFDIKTQFLFARTQYPMSSNGIIVEDYWEESGVQTKHLEYTSIGERYSTHKETVRHPSGELKLMYFL